MLVVISIEQKELPEHTKEQFEEWIKYSVGQKSGIKVDNPLALHRLNARVLEIG